MGPATPNWTSNTLSHTLVSLLPHCSKDTPGWAPPPLPPRTAFLFSDGSLWFVIVSPLSLAPETQHLSLFLEHKFTPSPVAASPTPEESLMGSPHLRTPRQALPFPIGRRSISFLFLSRQSPGGGGEDGVIYGNIGK